MTVMSMVVVGMGVGGGADLRVDGYERRGSHGQDANAPMVRDRNGRGGAEAKHLVQPRETVGHLLAKTRPHAFAWASGASGERWAVVPDDGGDGEGANVGVISQCMTESNTTRCFVWKIHDIDANRTGPDRNW